MEEDMNNNDNMSCKNCLWYQIGTEETMEFCDGCVDYSMYFNPKEEIDDEEDEDI